MRFFYSFVKKHLPVMNDVFLTRVTTMLVLLLTVAHMSSYVSGFSRRHPHMHTATMLSGYLLTAPFFLLLNETLHTPTFLFATNLILFVLQWFAFDQKKERFSEEKAILGSARNTAYYFAILTHVTNVFTMASGVTPYLTDRMSKLTFKVTLLFYFIMSCVATRKMTTRGDLRHKKPIEKCYHAKLMNNVWRGALCDCMSFLAILNGSAAVMKASPGSFTTSLKSTVQSRTLIVTIVLQLLVPIVTSYMAASTEHGIEASTLGLPKCFDDET